MNSKITNKITDGDSSIIYTIWSMPLDLMLSDGCYRADAIWWMPLD